MLHFFRRFQRQIFLVITVVIITSFSFFGTYNTIPAENLRDQTAFTAIDGSEIKRSDLEEMVLFLGSDTEDKAIFGGVWGPNFLNDGVIRKDFLQTGLAQILAVNYEPSLSSDLQKRFEKEQRYVLYSHPEAAFLNMEAVWDYFSPDMKKNYQTLKRAPNATTEEALTARIRLYLGERRLPSPMVKQVLRYQEKQNSWVTPDPNLDRLDLSLFGYHTLEDWFGSKFLRIISEFVINASKVAEQKGYVVTKDEALADLIRNAQTSYQQNLRNPNLAVANNAEYMNEQLRRMNMDQALAVKVWRQVLLFRRLFQDVGQSVLVDPFSFQQLNTYAQESAAGELYQLPKELQVNDYASLQKLEAYLSAVSKRPTEEAQLLTLPTTFLSAAEIEKKTPELVQKRYLLEISQVDKAKLQAKIGVKESWNWQVEDQNWNVLKKEFPELATKPGATREERFATLDGLDSRTRSRVDTFTRQAILDKKPEMIQKSLGEADAVQQVVGITLKGKTAPFEELKDPKALIALLDQAPLAGQEENASEAAKKAQEKLNAYSTNNQQFYKIRVLEKAPNLEVLTFAEANKKGVLDSLVNAQLEAYYTKNRAQNPTAFQKEDQSWKPFAEVKTKVADLYFAKILKAIRQDYAKATPKEKKQELTTSDNTAPFRLYAYLRSTKETLEKSPEKSSEYAKEVVKKDNNNKLEEQEPLASQWKLERKEYRIDRSKEENKLNLPETLAMDVGGWTLVQVSANGDGFFFHKTGNGSTDISPVVADKIEQARKLLSDDSQRAYMKHLVADIKAKNAISLDYMNTSYEMTNEMPVEESEG